MGQPAFEAEQIWLRSFLDYEDDVCVEIPAQRSMASYGISLSDVLYVLRNGNIVSSERQVDGALIVITGRNCDEEEIEVCGRMVSEMMHVSVINVRKVLRILK